MADHVAERPWLSRPDPFWLALGSIAVTGISLLAWFLIDLSAMLLNPAVSEAWIYTGLALPGATFGSLAAHNRARRLYFLAGLAITLIPVFAYVFLSATTPPPPERWND